MRIAKVGLIAAAVALAAGTAACTPGNQASSAPATKVTASPTKKASPLPADPTWSGTPAGARADVKLNACPTDAGTQTATGEVTNSTQSARDYAIMVIWLKKDNSTPFGSGMAIVKGVQPGQKVEWSVKADVVDKTDQCTLNVRAGAIR